MLNLSEAGVNISLISVGLTLLSTLVRNVVLDKNVMKEQKEKISHHKKQADEAIKRKDMKAAQTHQQQMLEVSMEQMRHGFKPMLFTLIPFLLVFQWMGTTYGSIGNIYNVTFIEHMPQDVGYTTVDLAGPGRYVSENRTIVWNMTDLMPQTRGQYNVTVSLENGGFDLSSAPLEVEYTIHNQSVARLSSTGLEEAKDNLLTVGRTQPTVNGNKAVYSIVYTETGSSTVADIFGWELGWFWWYFICSMISGMAFNKIFGFM